MMVHNCVAALRLEVPYSLIGFVLCWKILPPSSMLAFEVEAICPSETLVNS
jgi:hypothetical protein